MDPRIFIDTEAEEDSPSRPSSPASSLPPGSPLPEDDDFIDDGRLPPDCDRHPRYPSTAMEFSTRCWHSRLPNGIHM